MRFFFAVGFGIALVAVGIFLQGKSDHSLALSLGHRSLQRLVYDELNLRTQPNWRSEEVSGDLAFAGQQVRVLLRALPTAGTLGLTAVSVQVDEDQGVELRDLVLVNLRSSEAAVLQRAPSPAPLARGELVVNGKTAGEYGVYAHPFIRTLQNGEGPLARSGPAGLTVSQQSRSFPLLVKLAEQHAKEIPVLESSAWAVWNPQTNQWRVWGHWPEGWSL